MQLIGLSSRCLVQDPLSFAIVFGIVSGMMVSIGSISYLVCWGAGCSRGVVLWHHTMHDGELACSADHLPLQCLMRCLTLVSRCLVLPLRCTCR